MPSDRDSVAHPAQSATRGWEQARQTIEDLRAARGVPREEFPGHKEIYCSNLEGFLGGRFPVLLAERDELVAEVERLRGVMAVRYMDVIEAMIAETKSRGRHFPKPIMGGPKAAPFDGEELGKFIRTKILEEVRDRLAAASDEKRGDRG